MSKFFCFVFTYYCICYALKTLLLISTNVCVIIFLTFFCEPSYLFTCANIWRKFDRRWVCVPKCNKCCAYVMKICWSWIWVKSLKHLSLKTFFPSKAYKNFWAGRCCSGPTAFDKELITNNAFLLSSVSVTDLHVNTTQVFVWRFTHDK